MVMKENCPDRVRCLIRLLALIVIAVVVALGSGCSTVPVTGRSQLNLMSPSQEMQLGLTSFAA